LGVVTTSGSTDTHANIWTTRPYTFKPKPGEHLQFLCFECWKIKQEAYEAHLGSDDHGGHTN
jgi:hypothetical protein